MPNQDSVECVIHLFSLKPGTELSTLLKDLNQDSASSPILIKGRPHRWVLRPHHRNKEELLKNDWDLFVLARYSLLPELASSDAVAAMTSIVVLIPGTPFESMVSRTDSVPKPMKSTPPLPNEWDKAGGIPSSAILKSTSDQPLRVGELKLDPEMADFLSNALPTEVSNKPVSLFNLFKYPKGDSSVHDAYMEGFKNNFGNTAGAQVKFMGPVRSGIGYEEFPSPNDSHDDKGKVWEDANLVQYDTIWHYAYMLSTDIYQELNQEKMRGLEDTCILLVSEVELL